MISKANLKLIEGALEIQENEPDELAFIASNLCRLPSPTPSQARILTFGHAPIDTSLPRRYFSG